MNYKELSKLYPQFKIPCNKHAQYYIDTLTSENICSARTVALMQELGKIEFDVEKYKFVKMYEILNHFKIQNWDLSKINAVCKYELQGFNNYDAKKYYLSIDLSEANWQSFKHILNLDLPMWTPWVESTFNIHSAISESKSFRQLVFGNTNPKKLAIVQKNLMLNVIEKLPLEIQSKIVSKSSDEIILEFDDIPDSEMIYLSQHLSGTHTCLYKMHYEKSLNETVKIKTYFSWDNEEIKKELIAVPGNRYFIHLKNIILKKPILEEDLCFSLEKNMAKWVL